MLIGEETLIYLKSSISPAPIETDDTSTLNIVVGTPLKSTALSNVKYE